MLGPWQANGHGGSQSSMQWCSFATPIRAVQIDAVAEHICASGSGATSNPDGLVCLAQFFAIRMGWMRCQLSAQR